MKARGLSDSSPVVIVDKLLLAPVEKLIRINAMVARQHRVELS